MIVNSEIDQLLTEFHRRSKHEIRSYVPDNTIGHDQLSYHKSNAHIRLLFGGNQSGKSHAAAYDLCCHARGSNPWGLPEITGKNVEIWVISPLYVTVKTGIYRHMKRIMPDWDTVKEGPKVVGHELPSFVRVRRQDNFETTISLLSTQGDNRDKFQAAAVDYIYIDEEIERSVWEELQYRVLATAGRFSISATLVESYDWIVELEEQGEMSNPDVFITRLNTELNPYLDKRTVERIGDRIDDETKEYRFYGKSRKSTGLVYKDFDVEQHLIKPFDIPPEWPKWQATDPGIRVCAGLWITVGPNGRAYAYRELYAKNEPLWQVALEIKKLEGWKFAEELSFKLGHYVFLPPNTSSVSEEIVLRVIDPKSRARSEAGEQSILDQLYVRYGLVCTPADNSLRPGIEDCRFWLRVMEDGLPRIQFFNTLTNFVREIKQYRYRPVASRKNANETIDEPVRKANHLMDCWRYIAREKPSYNDRLKTFEARKVLSTSERIELNKYKMGSDSLISSVMGSEW